MSRASTLVVSSSSAWPLSAANAAVRAASGGCGRVSRTSRCRVHSPPLRTSLGTPGRGTIEPNLAPPPA